MTCAENFPEMSRSFYKTAAIFKITYNNIFKHNVQAYSYLLDNIQSYKNLCFIFRLGNFTSNKRIIL